MRITQVISTTIANGIRNIKSLLVSGDAMTPYQAQPFGFDSSPLPNTKAIYSTTKINGQNVIVGFLQSLSQVADGESKMFAVNSSGQIIGEILCNADGQILIGVTNADKIKIGKEGTPIIFDNGSNHATQYEALNTALTSYFTALNAAISSGVSGAGGVYAPPAPIDLSGSLLNDIHVP